MEPEILPAVLFVAIFIGIAMLFDWKKKTRFVAEQTKLESAWYPEATIAKNLAPKLHRLMSENPAFKSPTLYIVGGDGYPLWLESVYPWIGCLKGCLNAGCTIHYVLTKPNWNVIRKLTNLKAELSA